MPARWAGDGVPFTEAQQSGELFSDSAGSGGDTGGACTAHAVRGGFYFLNQHIVLCMFKNTAAIVLAMVVML